MTEALTEIKKNIVEMAHYSHASHVGSALSVVDVLYVLYGRVARIGKKNINDRLRDRILLSKAHACSALYAVLAHFGLIPFEWLKRYCVNGSILPAHLDKSISPAIDLSAGSLGHGLSVGIGMALADPDHNVYVVCGDGECNEGSVWEAFMLLGQMKLKNVTVIVDFNGLQALGRTKDIINQENLSKRLEAFGLDACDIDGHNQDAIENALKKTSDRTKAIVSHTIKGHGVSYMENNPVWHYRSPDASQTRQAFEELENAQHFS